MVMLEAALSSLGNRRGMLGAAQVLESSGLHHVTMVGLGSMGLMLNSDGIGTKVEVAERVGRFDTLGHDLVAMLADDAVRFGAEPIAMSNVLDISEADPGVARDLALGLREGADAARISILSGEVAELGHRVATEVPDSVALNWSGCLLSLVDPGRVLTGREIRPGQSIVALREEGFRSNGFTRARAILRDHLGLCWQEARACTGETWGDVLLRPSRIYAPHVVAALSRQLPLEEGLVQGVVHVTGGGIPGKLMRLLGPFGLGATLNGLHPPPPEMEQLRKLERMSLDEAYENWNMGNGMLLITSRPEALLGAFEEAPVQAKVAGRIVESREVVLQAERRRIRWGG